ncbi:MAG TPA: arginine-ornithine antiporter [Candidatus Saccharimonadales bacterium]|nr:arginine-ornithine antiporter [Candidatus Saccharimonadales bacterium]
MAATTKAKEKKGALGIIPLTALVVGSIIGGGIFNLMSDMSSSASLMAITIGWIITGLGMLFLAFCFQNLTKKRPDLDAGIYSYAQAGFGKYMGFNSAWGYWISAWIGNVAYATLLFSSVAYFFKTFGDGQNVASVIGASVMLWVVYYLVMRGVRSASIVNTIVTVAKLIPIAIFILAAFTAFKLDVFTADIWGTASKGFEFSDVMSQVKGTMLVTVWVFIGIEGAVVFSGRAKKKSQVITATFMGLLTVTSIYFLVTALSLGLKARPELAELGQPAMAELLKYVVGSWGAGLVNLGLIVSVAGAWLAWTLYAAELPYQAAKTKTFPSYFAKLNDKGTPVVSLLVTTVLIQAFLLLFLTDIQAYDYMYSLATSAILLPYAFTGFYQLKHSWQESKGTPARAWNIFVGAVASIYAIWLVYAAGMHYLLLTVLLYAPAVVIYILMQIKNREKVFTLPETGAAAILVALFLFCIARIASGDLSVL